MKRFNEAQYRDKIRFLTEIQDWITSLEGFDAKQSKKNKKWLAWAGPRINYLQKKADNE